MGANLLEAEGVNVTILGFLSFIFSQMSDWDWKVFAVVFGLGDLFGMFTVAILSGRWEEP